MRTSRRTLLQVASAFVAGPLAAGHAHTGEKKPTHTAENKPGASPVPCQAITHGPRRHWFGYYDKLEFDPTGRFVLGMEVDFEHRSPRPDDRIAIGMVDLASGNRWIELGTSTAWCWQQGCMLQWRPGSASEIVWNDRQGDRYVCRILDVQTRQLRTVPYPVYCLSPDGRWGIVTDFRRVADTRPGYGYNGIPDPWADERAPRESGIWHVDLSAGRQRLIVSLADAARIPFPHGDFGDAKHWFNQLLVNPDGSRVVFLHRWKSGAGGFRTRMFTARPDGSELRVLIGSGFVSHFIWRDPRHILAYSKPTPEAAWGFYLYEDKPGGTVAEVGKGVMGSGDGHCSYLPGNQWILCDTYPDHKREIQVYLYHIPTHRRVNLGRFFQPAEYWASPPHYEWRCDLHPRHSPDGTKVVIDSPHGGQGRQLYLIDIAAIVG